jgi:hypothetical protein
MKDPLRKPLKTQGNEMEMDPGARKQEPGKMPMKQLPDGGKQGHPNKMPQTAGDMRFIED